VCLAGRIRLARKTWLPTHLQVPQSRWVLLAAWPRPRARANLDAGSSGSGPEVTERMLAKLWERLPRRHRQVTNRPDGH
jgi:hypothetical protein